MASTIQIPAEGRAVRSAGERKSPKTSHETSQSNAAAEAGSEPQITAEHLPEHHEIAQLAYSYWENRGYEHGFADEDWLRAERELREQRTAQAGPNKSH
jgi:hypothetical protein